MKSPSTIKYTYIAVFNITNKDYIIIIDAAMRLLPSGSVSIIICVINLKVTVVTDTCYAVKDECTL